MSLSEIRTACLALAAALVLSACTGFTPAYQSGNQWRGWIAFETPADRTEQVLFNELKRSFGASGTRYTFSVGLSEEVDATLVTATDDPRKARQLTLTGTWKLRDFRSDEVVADASRTATVSFETSPQGLGDDIALEQARERAAKRLAEIIRADLITYFSVSGQ